MKKYIGIILLTDKEIESTPFRNLQDVYAWINQALARYNARRFRVDTIDTKRKEIQMGMEGL
jgi:hypothetical protein